MLKPLPRSVIDRSILVDIKIYQNSINVTCTDQQIQNFMLSNSIISLKKNKKQFRRFLKKIDTYETKYIKYKIIMKYGFLTKMTNIFISYFFF